jgi:hypothetical protein
VGCDEAISFVVIAGLDPAIHPLRKHFRRMMDARVKPGHDEPIFFPLDRRILAWSRGV